MSTISGEVVSGTFTGTGVSAETGLRTGHLSLSFAGAATIAFQWTLDGTNWRTVESFTSSAEKVIDLAYNTKVRLECTAHTNDVTYNITPNPSGT